MREQLRQLGEIGRALWEWARRNPLQAFLFAAALATVVYFFGFLPLYANRAQSIWTWAWMRFLPQYNQEHSKLIPLIVLFLVWYHRDEIRKAPKQGNNLGLIFLAIGILCYVIGARALQPRIAIFGFPFLAFGSVLFLWGKQMARVLLFPIALLFFMTPLGAIEQTTFRLQFLIIDVVGALSRLFGIAIYSVGTAIYPVSGKWQGFDIAEGCSGIRSLIAMIMVTAIYVHICERKFWKKITILCFSVLFAIIGNAGRIFTIIVLAKLGFPKFAGGLYHDWSDWVFFPVALLSMYGFAKLLSVNFKTFRMRKRPKEKDAVVYDY